MITLLGTGHVFNLRARVQEEIYRRAPTVVALELDPARYAALRNPPKDRKGVPFAYRMLAEFQRRIAEGYGVNAGDEMLAGGDAARDLGAQVALVDRDVTVTFQRLMKEMSLSEKARLFGSALASAVLPGKMVEEQIAEMEKDYTVFFRAMEKKYPTLKRVLLDERNEYMAVRLAKLAEEHPNLVAVLGDGHVDGILDILRAQGLEVEALRLKDLRAAPPDDGAGTPVAVGPAPHVDATAASASFSVEVDAADTLSPDPEAAREDP